MADRRRANGPPGGTVPPVFVSCLNYKASCPAKRTRAPDELRKIFLKTGLTPSASGSAYFELDPSTPTVTSKSLANKASALKLACTVHGPRPLPRSAPFSPQLLLSTRVKFAPFAERQRRGYISDAGERDIAAHLETALRGVIIGGGWPKSGVDVIVTVLEGEEDSHWDKGQLNESGRTGCWGMMSILSGCINVASAAIIDAGIDCIDVVTGGVAAIVRQPNALPQVILDPCLSDHEEILAACVIGYVQTEDEITELWTKGNILAFTNVNGANTVGFEPLVEQAVEAAITARLVLIDAIKESSEVKVQTGRIDLSKNTVS